MAARTRLDRLLVARGLAPNRTRAQALILAGRVHSGERRLDKPGQELPDDAPLDIRPGRVWVGRGAHKLLGALDAFGVDPAGRDAMDVGASTGGFVEVLLARGAARVIAVDVGRGQLDWSLRRRDDVHVLEGCNARYLEPAQLPWRPSLVTMDVSFISVEKILPALAGCLEEGADVVSLVKPQFEVGRGRVGRGGIVRDPALHREVLAGLARRAAERGWGPQALAASAIRGADGNREFFLHLRPGAPPAAAAALEAAAAALAAEEEEAP